jgi:hypothetical protein
METMATDGRRTAPPVEDELFEEGDRFDFFQAVRLLTLRRSREPVRFGPRWTWASLRRMWCGWSAPGTRASLRR